MNPNGPDDDTLTCPLCFNDLPLADFFVLELCHCCYCIKCITTYAEHEIKKGKFRIPCPDEGCDVKGVLTAKEIISLVSGEILERYGRILKDAKVSMDPNRVYCPAPDCGESCDNDPSGPERVVCPSCSTAFCRQCSSIWHEGQTCEEYYNATASFSELGIRRCPGCRIPVQKAGGCPHMQCFWCGKKFVWY